MPPVAGEEAGGAGGDAHAAAPSTAPPPPADPPSSGSGQAPAGATAAADAPPPPPPAALDDDALLASFFAEVRAADREAEVDRVLGAFKLNPFEQVGVRFDADEAAVTRAYRKASLLVHPDKCSHPAAQDAFEVLNGAVAALRGAGTDGEARLKELRYVLDYSKAQVLAARAASLKGDAVARLAASVVEGGADAVQAAWEASDAFHEAWQAKARDVLARTAFKRQKLVARLKEAAHREEAEEAAAAAEAKAGVKASKKWEETREARVGSWREFARGSSGGEKKNGEKKKARAAAPAAGALPFGFSAPIRPAAAAGPPPGDPAKPYVSRPAGPPPAKPPAPKRVRTGEGGEK